MPERVVRRRADPTATLADNRLLASWGHDVRELQLVLAGAGEHVDHHHAVEHRGDTLLARVQAACARTAPAEPGPVDRSLQVHSCHGRARQVEVLRDAILHLLDEDPTLEPRDVIVMCPDIETFAPLIQASFGAGEVSDEDDEIDALPEDIRPPDLRVRLADRSLRQTNPILGVVARLIELADERLTASQVLDLADREPVRRRFGFDDDDLARMEEWVRGERDPLGTRRRAPGAVQARGAARRHVAGRARPRARRRHDDRGRAAAVRRACSRSTTSRAARSSSPAASRSSSIACRLTLDALERVAVDRRVGAARSPGPPTR